MEAIEGDRRELLTERQKAELSITTPLPPAGDTTGGVQSDIPDETGMPQLAAKSRGHRRTLATAAAGMAVLVLSVAGGVRALLWRKAGKVATAPPAPVAVAVASIEPSPAVFQAPAPSPSPTRPIEPTKKSARNRRPRRPGRTTRRPRNEERSTRPVRRRPVAQGRLASSRRNPRRNHL